MVPIARRAPTKPSLPNTRPEGYGNVGAAGAVGWASKQRRTTKCPKPWVRGWVHAPALSAVLAL